MFQTLGDSDSLKKPKIETLSYWWLLFKLALKRREPELQRSPK
jgi:hypothetical protein